MAKAISKNLSIGSFLLVHVSDKQMKKKEHRNYRLYQKRKQRNNDSLTTKSIHTYIYRYQQSTIMIK